MLLKSLLKSDGSTDLKGYVDVHAERFADLVVFEDLTSRRMLSV